MTEEVKGLLKEASKKIKDDFIPSITNLLMDVFQHGVNKGIEIGVKIGAGKIQSSIKWKTGRPEETGSYLVSVGGRFVTTDYWYCLKGKWQYWEGEVIAWCKLDDIEPYKEETK